MDTSFWFNFRTDEYDTDVDTSKDLKDYIPQSDASKNLYDLYVDHLGKSHLEALMEVLKANLGIKAND